MSWPDAGNSLLHPTTGQANRNKITGKQAGQLNSHHAQGKWKMDAATFSLFGALVWILLSSRITVLAVSATASGTVPEILMQPNTKLEMWTKSNPNSIVPMYLHLILEFVPLLVWYNGQAARGPCVDDH